MQNCGAGGLFQRHRGRKWWQGWTHSRCTVNEYDRWSISAWPDIALDHKNCARAHAMAEKAREHGNFSKLAPYKPTSAPLRHRGLIIFSSTKLWGLLSSCEFPWYYILSIMPSRWKHLIMKKHGKFRPCRAAQVVRDTHRMSYTWNDMLATDGQSPKCAQTRKL